MSRQPRRGELLRRLSGAARYAGGKALDLLLPPSCVACDQPVVAPGQLCADCYRRTGFITEPCCRRCGVPFGYPSQGGLDQLCPACRTIEPAFDRARAAFLYDRQARRLILPFKYADRTEIAVALAPHMARAGAALLAEADLLVPVPLHPSRLFRRRYNQAALLARALARIARKSALPDALVRIRATNPLADLSAVQRQQEVAGVFAVRHSRAQRIEGQRILLVDDVMTSGATVGGCALALRAAGAIGVDVLTAARVPDPRLTRWDATAALEEEEEGGLP
jgi:ComF family protein